jgi:hypothetical protein
MSVVALTRDFHVFASRVTTLLSAILFSVWYIAEAWDVRALSCLLIRHYNSVLSRSLIHSQQATLTWPRLLYQPQRLGETSLTLDNQLPAATSSRLIAWRSPNFASLLARDFSRFYGEQCKENKFQDVNRLIAGSAFGRFSADTHAVMTSCVLATLDPYLYPN